MKNLCEVDCVVENDCVSDQVVVFDCFFLFFWIVVCDYFFFVEEVLFGEVIVGFDFIGGCCDFFAQFQV